MKTLKEALLLETNEPTAIAEGGVIRPLSFRIMTRDWGKSVEAEFLKDPFLREFIDGK